MIKYRKQRFVKLKVIMVLILALILAAQIWFVVTLIQYSTKDYRSVTPDDFISLTEGEEVKGIISRSQVIAYFENTYNGSKREGDVTLSEIPSVRTRNIVVSDKVGNIFLMYAKLGELSGNYDDLGKLMDGSIGSLSYKGKVTGFFGISREDVLSEINNADKTRKYKLEKIIENAIELNEANETQDVSYLITSIIGALMIFALIVFLLWKSVNNFIYGCLVNSGKIEPELKIRREDLIIQNDVNYAGSDNDSDSFYVNTEEKDQTSENTETNSDPVSSEYHFTKRMRENENNNISYERKEPTFSDGSPIDFYSGGVNEDGNFYVDKSNAPSVDSDGEELKKY